MEFNQVAYCVIVPLLLLLVWFSRNSAGRVAKNILAVVNLLLIGHAVFLIRQMIGFYYLVKQYGELPKGPPPPIDFAGVRLLLIITLPFLSLIGPVRRNTLFSLVLLFLLYGHHPYFTWNTFDLFTKMAVYFSLFCFVYALLWLLKKLPYQSV